MYPGTRLGQPVRFPLMSPVCAPPNLLTPPPFFPPRVGLPRPCLVHSLFSPSLPLILFNNHFDYCILFFSLIFI